MSTELHKQILTVLFYDEEQGLFTWKISAGSVKAGRRAGSPTASGYRRIKIKGKWYLEHRLVWFYHHGEWPPEEIDHINHVKNDNRLDNLRLASRKDNTKNQSMNTRNTSGVQGVSYCKRDKLWRVHANKDGKLFHSSYHKSFYKAVAIRKAFEYLLGYHPNHGQPLQRCIRYG